MDEQRQTDDTEITSETSRRSVLKRAGAVLAGAFGLAALGQDRVLAGGKVWCPYCCKYHAPPICLRNPTNINQCKNGGFARYRFRNQGQCIRYVNTGKDSR